MNGIVTLITNGIKRKFHHKMEIVCRYCYKMGFLGYLFKKILEICLIPFKESFTLKIAEILNLTTDVFLFIPLFILNNNEYSF